MLSLQGKVAVITGGGSGIGEAATWQFSRAGAKVVVADTRDASDVAKKVGGIYMHTDVSKEAQVKRLMETAVSEFGKLDIVVNNAGIDFMSLIQDQTEEDLDRVFSVNVKGVLWGIKHSIPHISDGGSIINTSSIAGLMGLPNYGAYVASKFAVVGLTKTAALELAPRRIRVNCICPGAVDTPMLQKETQEVARALVSYTHPIGRAGKAEEVATLMHFLASDESANITGTAIPNDGGFCAGLGLSLMEPLVEMVTANK